MDYIYENPTFAPQESPHWKALPHQAGDRCIQDLSQLQEELQENDTRLALWSALLGYCEALCTSSKQRYHPFPIPIDAIQRLVETEFQPPTTTCSSKGASHGDAAREISNYIWSRVVSKSNIKDEKHANSLYTVLRGNIEGKSVDCFGAAVVTVIALRQEGYESILTLSEDHAYTTHEETTSEVAIPGNTKAQRQKRGQEISKTFQNKDLTVQDSWLYMAGNAVQCNTSSTVLAAILSNLNCLIEMKSNYEKYSQVLLEIKRELLWKLYDSGHLAEFPFALCELAWSGTSANSLDWRAYGQISPKLGCQARLACPQSCFQTLAKTCFPFFGEKEARA